MPQVKGAVTYRHGSAPSAGSGTRPARRKDEVMMKRDERCGFWQLLARVALAGWPATLRLALLLVVVTTCATAPRLLS
ncbi:MAG: hypothetical protein BGO26_00050 [Actinobacteria bacterium 69-20]|jgi:hypothetical protein|nr:MAG: hypothetical protein BGO26_00050 [Actinobacteria bacterium 69-20]